jgi:hypothetical protein
MSHNTRPAIDQRRSSSAPDYQSPLPSPKPRPFWRRPIKAWGAVEWLFAVFFGGIVMFVLYLVVMYFLFHWRIITLPDHR